MWTEITRGQHAREGLRYASDLTDAEWALIEPFMPVCRRLGRPRKTSLRSVVEAILYIVSTGCQWRALPKEFPPYSTVQGYFYRWRDEGRWQKIHDHLVSRARRQLGRKPKPSAAVIDTQSVATTESGGPRGLDPAKKVSGRKRHIVTDTEGFLLARRVHPADIQDPHGAPPLLRTLRHRFPRLRHVFADRLYRGQQLRDAVADCGPWDIEIVARPPGTKGFQVLPKRWVVERTYAWLGRSRRLAKDFEASITSAEAWITVASLKILARRVARQLSEVPANTRL